MKQFKIKFVLNDKDLANPYFWAFKNPQDFERDAVTIIAECSSVLQASLILASHLIESKCNPKSVTISENL